MRIISGSLKGRQISFPKLKNAEALTRPTTDFARESLFNILQNWIEIEDAQVLDLFSGTGAIGFEFISRGAKQVSFVEKNAICTQHIQQHCEIFKLEKSQYQILKTDVFGFLAYAKQPYDIIFADAPYALPQTALLPKLVFEQQLLNKGGVLIVEHDKSHNFENAPQFVETRNYGKSIFSFFENKEAQ